MRSRLAELRNHLLPRKFSPTGVYTDRQLDLARGYRLLVHAEIESYLEDVTRDVVTMAIQDWKNNQKPSLVLISFLASYHSSWNIDEEVSNEEIIKIAKSRKNVKDSVNEIIDLAQKQFIQKIKDNHGIKSKNLKTLVLPAGVNVDGLDLTWLTNLDNFGSQRGETAHKTKRATGQINPQDEYSTVKALLKGLEEFDRQIYAW
ncbi:MAG: HEPN domain-containing protein [Methylobacter sp.]